MSAAKELESVIEKAHEWLDEEQAEAALTALAEALAGRETNGRDVLLAEARGLAAVAARALGKDREAMEWSDRALAAIGEGEVEDPEQARVFANLLEDRAELELEARAPSTAGALLRRAIGLRETSGDEVGPETWLALAEAEQRAGQEDAALAALARAEAIGEELGDDESLALGREMRGDVELARAEPQAALAAYAAAERGWRALDDREGIERCIVGRARASERLDDTAGIERACEDLDALGAHELAAQLRSGDIG